MKFFKADLFIKLCCAFIILGACKSTKFNRQEQRRTSSATQNHDQLPNCEQVKQQGGQVVADLGNGVFRYQLPNGQVVECRADHAQTNPGYNPYYPDGTPNNNPGNPNTGYNPYYPDGPVGQEPGPNQIGNPNYNPGPNCVGCPQPVAVNQPSCSPCASGCNQPCAQSCQQPCQQSCANSCGYNSCQQTCQPSCRYVYYKSKCGKYYRKKVCQ